MMQPEYSKLKVKPIAPVPTGLEPSGKLKKKIKAVLYDIYGTLFISGSGDISIAEKELKYSEKLQALFKKFAVNKTAVQVVDNFFSEIGKTHKEMKSRGVDYPEVNIDHVWQEVMGFKNIEAAREFAVEYEVAVNPAFPMPNLEKTLTMLRREKIPMGIISNAQFFTPLLFNAYLGGGPENIGFNPNLIFMSYRHGFAKPSLHLFKEAVSRLEMMNIAPISTIYIGNDMLNDIYPARVVGFQTALFAGDKRSLRLRKDDQRCKNLKPNLVITDLYQIAEIMEL